MERHETCTASICVHKKTQKEAIAMRSLFVIKSAAIAVILVGCGARQGAATESARTTPAASAAQTTPSSEVATGQIREALLILQRIHVSFDSNQLSPETRALLADAADRLRAHPDVHLYVDGHSDQRGTAEYNVALGDQRGQSVKDYLAHMGIDRDRLHVVSFGEERPLVTGDDAVSYARNRRADFRLMRGDVRLVLEEGTPVDDRGRPIAVANTNVAGPHEDARMTSR